MGAVALCFVIILPNSLYGFVLNKELKDVKLQQTSDSKIRISSTKPLRHSFDGFMPQRFKSAVNRRKREVQLRIYFHRINGKGRKRSFCDRRPYLCGLVRQH